MAHFAQLDESNVVTRVIVVNNDELMVEGFESEQKGIEFCQSLFGGTWIQTSYNNQIRYNYAGIGFTYDPIDDAFVSPMPDCGHDSLLLNNVKKWECADCEAAFKSFSNPA
jgi:hypothetical protein